jgi:mannosyltransferase
MISVRSSKLTFVIGLLLIFAGIFVPSSAILAFIRQNSVEESLRNQLMLGAHLFRVGLVLLGSFVFFLGKIFAEDSKTLNKSEPIHSSGQSRMILALILLAATLLRLYGLNSGLWHDEILSIIEYVRMPYGEIISTCKDANQHFLYTLMAHASFDLFGENNWALRLPAVFFGVGSIWVLYLFGRLCTTEREALLSAALLTFSYYHIWFSQNARGYSGLLFFAILSSFLFLRALESRPRYWLYYAFATALGMYTNMTLMFVIFSHVIICMILLLFNRERIWHQKWIIVSGFVLSALLIFQLHALVLPQILGGVLGEESTVPAWINPMWTLLEFVKAMKTSFAGGILAVAALVVFSFGLVSYARTRPIVIGLFLIPILLCAVLVIGMGHHLWPRFFYFAFGFAALIAIRGVTVVTREIGKILKMPIRTDWTATALCIVLILFSATSIRYVYGPKQDFLGALHFVESQRKSGDAVVTVGLASIDFEDFYRMNWPQVQTLNDLLKIRNRSERTWLLYTFPMHVEAVYPEIMKSIRNDFVIVKEFYGTVGAGTIFVCRSDSPIHSSIVGRTESMRKGM